MTHNHTLVDLEMHQNHKIHTPVHNHSELHSTYLDMLEVEPILQVSPAKNEMRDILELKFLCYLNFEIK